MRDSQTFGHALQFAVTVGNADRTDVIAFREEHLHDHASDSSQSSESARDFHAFLHSRHTRRQQLVIAFYFHQAEAASAHIAETVQVAKRGYVDPILLATSRMV